MQDLETKLSLVRVFQDFAAEKGMAFEFEYNGHKVEIYRRYEDEDKPAYAISLAKRNSLSEPIVKTSLDKIKLEEQLKPYENNPDWERYVAVVHSYFKRGAVPLRPAHLKLNPCQLLGAVAHEGLHATVLHNGNKKHLNKELEESLAEASSYILLRQFGEESGFVDNAALQKQLVEMNERHEAVNYWLSRFEKFYLTKHSPKEFEEKRAKMFMEMQEHLRRIVTDPLHTELFDSKLNDGLNNASLAFFKPYSIHFENLLRLYDQCDCFKDFLERVSGLGRNMGKIIVHCNQASLVLPDKDFLLYAELDQEDTVLKIDKQRTGYKIRRVASTEGVRKTTKNKYRGKGKILFSVSNGFYRGEVDIDKAEIKQEGLEQFLEETDEINVHSESIAKVAQEIRNSIPKRHRENPYVLTKSIVGWITDNIEGTAISKHVLNPVVDAISRLSGEDNLDVYKVLKQVFAERADKNGVYIPVGDDVLREIAKFADLPAPLKDAEPAEIAKKIADSSKFASFFFRMCSEYYTSAEAVLESRSGKCVGITNLFLALSRNLGIPCREEDGFYGNINEGEWHSWAALYISPYGWVEVDPTLGEFEDFGYQDHAYVFSRTNEEHLNLTILNWGSATTDKVDEAIELLKREKPHQSKIDYLESLKSLMDEPGSKKRR